MENSFSKPFFVYHQSMHSELQIARRVRAVGAQGKIGVISPASCVERSALEAGCRALGALDGWQVATSPFALLQGEGSFAGGAASRAAAFMEMWQRDDIDAVICARGGYGSNYLLPLLDFDALRMMPKAFVGYSDNTTLLLALERAGLVSFHGPMVASDFGAGRADVDSFRAALGAKPLDLSFSSDSPVRALVAGEARGTVTGGCLSLVVASLGTPWEIETSGKLLFLEEEEPLTDIIRRILGSLGIPIVTGFPSGHVDKGNITLPFGVPAMLHGSQAGVRLQVEPATFMAMRYANS
jgi:muramoyltetrapeptide carboxypeptidase